MAWQGGISGLKIQNNSVVPRKAGYYFYWKKWVIQFLPGKLWKWFKGLLLISSLFYAVAQASLFKLKNIWKVRSKARSTITHWTDVFLSASYPLHLRSVWDSRIVTEHLFCFIFVHFLKKKKFLHIYAFWAQDIQIPQKLLVADERPDPCPVST